MLALAACGGSSDTGGTGSGSGSSDEKIAVSLITKDSHQPVLRRHAGGRQEGRATSRGSTSRSPPARRKATTRARSTPSRAPITSKQQGILITPMSTGVNDAIQKARDAGLFVIALDTPTDPPDVGRHHLRDRQPRGRQADRPVRRRASSTARRPSIALLDIFDDKIVSVDYNRDQGFLEGMGIDDIGDPKKNGDEPEVHGGTGRRLRDRRQRSHRRQRGGRPDGHGEAAVQEQRHQRGLHDQRADRSRRLCSAEAPARRPTTSSWSRSTVAGQACRPSQTARSTRPRSSTPLKMAELGVQAIVDIVKNGTKPENHPGPRLLQHRRHADRQGTGRGRREQGPAVRARQRVGLSLSP